MVFTIVFPTSTIIFRFEFLIITTYLLLLARPAILHAILNYFWKNNLSEYSKVNSIYFVLFPDKNSERKNIYSKAAKNIKRNEIAKCDPIFKKSHKWRECCLFTIILGDKVARRLFLLVIIKKKKEFIVHVTMYKNGQKEQL